MNLRSKLVVLLIVVGILGISAASLMLRARLRCAGFAGPGVTIEELPNESSAKGNLRIASWNVRNFPLDERPQTDDLGYSRRTNICDLETVLRGLDADIFGLQEICDTRRFPPILKRARGMDPMRVVFSVGGGRFGQHLAIVWDDSRLELVGDPIEITEVVVEEGLRPALAGYFRSRQPGGIDFTMVVVHLQASQEGFENRRRQYRALAKWTHEWVAKIGDPDLVMLGDFNTTGSPRGGLEGELQSIDTILGRAGLLRLPNQTGCSEFWEGGGPRDGVQVPSLLDHVFLRGIGEDLVVAPLQAWLHCARYECAELVSRLGEEDGTFWDVSDHCPLTFELRDSVPRGQD